MKTVYQTDEDNVLVHSVSIAEQPGIGYCLPFGAVDVAPPPAEVGHAALWASDVPRSMPGFGEAGSGSWLLELDYRAVALYDTRTGARYELGREVDGERFKGLGTPPAWLTEKAWPGPPYEWNGADWALDADAQRAVQEAAERAWRDAEIARTDYLALADYPLEAGMRAELLTYRQSLRDWPAAAGFPESSRRPAAPAWLDAMTE